MPDPDVLRETDELLIRVLLSDGLYTEDEARRLLADPPTSRQGEPSPPREPATIPRVS